MRLIDGDALKDLMVETLENIAKRPEMTGQEMHIIAGMHMLGQMIDDAETIETLPVILSRDLKHDEVVSLCEFFRRLGNNNPGYLYPYVEPFIRCRDCKHFDEEDLNNVCGRLCVYFAKPDDFCSRGERRSP